MLHFSHAVTDGVGGVEIFASVYDLERDAPPSDAPPLPIPQDLSPNDLMRQGLTRLPFCILRGVCGALRLYHDAFGLPVDTLPMAVPIAKVRAQMTRKREERGDTHIAGAKILRQYGIGPLPGVAMMVVLVSRSGFCMVTARYDRASITDPDLFAECLLAGFDEVVAIGGPGRASPASFTLESEPPSPNGSAPQ